MAPSVFDKRLLIQTGKGGVGKTTLTAAFAMAFAARGKRVLILQANARDRLGAWFGRAPVGPEIAELAPGIFAVNTTMEDAIEEYALLRLRSRLLYRAVFDNRIVRRLTRMVPGLPELLIVGKAWHHEQERGEDGLPLWDAVLLDAPATGHGLFLLQIPNVITGALTSGLMVEESRHIAELLEDPKRTAVHLITLAEEMPVNETLEYHAQIRSQSRVPLGAVLTNGVFSHPFNEQEARWIHDLRDAHGKEDDPLDRILAAGLFRQERCTLQRAYLERLRREVDLPVVEIRYSFAPRMQERVLRQIATELEEGFREAST